MVEPDRNGHPNLLHQVRRYLKINSIKGAADVYAQHLHRLDRPVSGIVLFAKQRSVLRNLSDQFAQRQVKKYYQALTSNAPDRLEGTLEGWHKKEKKKAVLAAEQLPGMEAVSLTYRVQEFSNNRFLWDIELHTGKYHQIRAQLAAAECPIVGDHLYGAVESYKPDSIALHASKLGFFHPITDEFMVVESAVTFL